MNRLFGFEFKKVTPQQELPSFVPQSNTDDGAAIITAGGSFGQAIDLDGVVRSEAELVTKYREMAIQPECDSAVDEIVNEMISIDEEHVVNINLDALKVSDNTKAIIRQEFDHCLNLLEFNKYAYEIVRRWYIDGRLYYHIVIDEKAPNLGIQELRYVDPRKIRKVREVQKKKLPQNNSTEATVTKTVNEYFIFNDKGFNFGNKMMGTSTTGFRIAKDSILHCVSGLTDNQGTMVLSYLHKAIKPLNQLRTIEDALVIYRLSRAPERRIWYIDVGNLPKMKAEQYVRDIMVKHKNRLVYDAQTGQIKDDRKFMCYALDTKIPLLDGRNVTLQTLMDEYESGKKNWVYSCDPITGKFVPGPVSWAGVTKKNAQVVKVTFDNGKSVVCTPDHKFPVWGKGFVEAQYLVGESIIPGYRRNEKIGNNEYEQIFQNENKTWEYTHRLVSNWKDENNIRDKFLYKASIIKESSKVIHHNDFNRFNNTPENLIIMDHKDHFKFHSYLNETRWSTDSEYRNKMINIQTIEYPESMIEKVKAYKGSNITYNELLSILNEDNLDFINANKEKRIKNKPVGKVVYGDLIRILIKLGYNGWTEFRDEVVINNKKYRSVSSTVKELDVTNVKHSLDSNISYRGSDEWKQKLSKSAEGRVNFSKSWKITTPTGEQLVIENLNEFCRNNELNRTNIKGKFGSKKYFAEELRNHKAVSVDWLDETIDVGCITVDLEETYHSHHTYLLDAGVYTKNTMLEDFWLPRREGGRGTEVTTLEGGKNLSQMDDVLYFQKKFLQSLNVPVSRLNSDALFSLGRATEITRDELKFDTFVTRLRLRFSHLLLELLRKQLLLKNITTIDDWNLFKNDIRFDFATDNYFSELKSAEIIQGRIQLARDVQDSAGKYYSHNWIRKNILHQTDQDILDQDNMISLEAQSQDPRWLNPAIEQSAMMVQQDQQMGGGNPDVQLQTGTEGSSGGVDPKLRKKAEEVRKAEIIVKQMKQLGKENRTSRDQTQYKAAVQVLAKNPELVRRNLANVEPGK